MVFFRATPITKGLAVTCRIMPSIKPIPSAFNSGPRQPAPQVIAVPSFWALVLPWRTEPWPAPRPPKALSLAVLRVSTEPPPTELPLLLSEAVPSAITEVERRAVTDAARRAGAADANLIEQPMAAAIGADLPIDEPVGNMVIDIGGGTSETAVISLGGIVALEAVRVGSFDIDAAIQNYIRREHGIAVGERTAEEIKMAIGSADPTPEAARLFPRRG